MGHVVVHAGEGVAGLVATEIVEEFVSGVRARVEAYGTHGA